MSDLLDPTKAGAGMPPALLEATRKPDQTGLVSCHSMSQHPDPEQTLPYQIYALDGSAYDKALKHEHYSQVYVTGEAHKASAFHSHTAGQIEVRQVSVIGNVDEEKSRRDEAQYGNIYVTVEPVSSMLQCPMLSPTRTIHAGRAGAFYKGLRALDRGKQPIDPQDHGFPEDVYDIGKEGRPEAGRIVPGPYQTHKPGDLTNAENQCEWASEQWAIMQYIPGLALVDLETTPGFKTSAYLCVRMYESNAFWDEDATLQAPIEVGALTRAGEITFGVNPQQSDSVVYGVGTAGRELAGRTAASVTIGYTPPAAP